MPWCTFSAVAGPGVVSAIKGASSSRINGGGAGSGRQRVQPLRLHRLAGMPDVAEAEPDPRRWLSLLTCCSALFMTLLDVSVTNVALPSIGRATGAAPSQLQWVVSGYTLAFGLVPVLAGRLGDDHGRRLMFQVGVGSFTATSILAGLSPSVSVLIGARVLQGLAGGLINPQVSGLVQQLFPGSERGRAFGVLGTTVGVGTAFGAFDRRRPHRARRTARGLAAGVLHQCPGRRGGDSAGQAAASCRSG